jgi:hypothetical protein
LSQNNSILVSKVKKPKNVHYIFRGSIYCKIISPPSPREGGNISRCNLGGKYEKGVRKGGKMQDKKEEKRG